MSTETSAWTTVTRLADGQPVKADTFNTPITELEKRDQFLYDRLVQLGLPKSSLILSGIQLADTNTPVIGDVVYVSPEGVATRALAELDPNDLFNTYEQAPVLGILTGQDVVTIYGEISGSLVSYDCTGANPTRPTSGFKVYKDNVHAENPVPGVYYLSSRAAGCITKEPNGPKVLIGTFLDGKAYLTPSSKDMATSHVHRSYTLKPVASDGTSEGWVTVTAGDYNGWHRYVMAQGSILANSYPPMPTGACSLVVNGLEKQLNEAAPTSEDFPDGDFAINNDGIYVNFNPISTSSIRFHWVRVVSGDTGPVTSLKPRAGSPIVIKKCGTTEDSSVGDLMIDLNWEAPESDEDEVDGYTVYKKYADGKFRRGPVVECLVPGAGITLSSTAAKDDLYRGTVTISASGFTSGEFDTIALQNAKQETIGLFPYVKIPDYSAAVPSAFTAKFQAPVNLANVNKGYHVRFYASIFGIVSSGSGGTDNLGFEYNILPNLYGTFAESNLQSILTAAQTKTLQITLPAGYSGFDPILLTNDSAFSGQDHSIVISNLFTPTAQGSTEDIVRPGYLLAVKFSAAASSSSGGSSYGATPALGFINLRWTVDPIPETSVGG